MGLVRRIIGMASRTARRPARTRPVRTRPVAGRPVGRRSTMGGVIGAIRGFLRGSGRARV